MLFLSAFSAGFLSILTCLPLIKLLSACFGTDFCLSPIGVTAKNNRLFVEALLYCYRAGIPWRDLPERFGHFRKAHTHYWSVKFKVTARVASI